MCHHNDGSTTLSEKRDAKFEPTKRTNIRSNSRMTRYTFASGLRRSCWTPEPRPQTPNSTLIGGLGNGVESSAISRLPRLDSESPMLTHSLGFTGLSLRFEGFHKVWRPTFLRIPCLQTEAWTRNAKQGILSMSIPAFQKPRNRIHAMFGRPFVLRGSRV